IAPLPLASHRPGRDTDPPRPAKLSTPVAAVDPGPSNRCAAHPIPPSDPLLLPDNGLPPDSMPGWLAPRPHPEAPVVDANAQSRLVRYPHRRTHPQSPTGRIGSTPTGGLLPNPSVRPGGRHQKWAATGMPPGCRRDCHQITRKPPAPAAPRNPSIAHWEIKQLAPPPHWPRPRKAAPLPVGYQAVAAIVQRVNLRPLTGLADLPAFRL